MKRSALIFLLVLCFNTILFSQMPWEKNIRLVDIPVQNNTPCGEVIGDFAVGVDDLGVTVWSLENPDEPRPHFRLPLPGAHWTWFRNGDYFYVESTIDREQFIDVVDISNPEIPAFRNRIQTMDDDLNGFRLYRGYLLGNCYYIPDSDHRVMRRLTLQDPLNPMMDDWEGEWAGEIIYKSGNLALGEEEINREYFYFLTVLGEDQPEEVFEINIEGDNSYIFNIVGEVLLSRSRDYLKIYDLSNPQQVREVSQIDIPCQFEASSSIPYLERRRSLVSFGDYIAISCGRDLYIMQIDDPANPEIMSIIESDLNYFHIPIFGNDERLYVIASYNENQLPYYDDDILIVLDVSDPQNMEVINEIRKKKISCSSANSELMSIRGDVISMVNCQAYFSSFRMDGLSAIPLNVIRGDLHEEREYPFYPSIYSVFNDNIAALSIGSEGLFIYDLADPENPRLLSNIDMEPSVPIIMNDSLLLIERGLGNSVSEISRYNVEDPNNPELISQVNYGEFREVVIDENVFFFNNKQSSRFEAAMWNEDEIDVRIAYESRLESFQKIDSLFVGYTDNGLTFLYPDLENEEFVELNYHAIPTDFRDREYQTLEPLVGPNGLIAIIDCEKIQMYDAKYPEQVRPLGYIELPYRIQLGAQWVGNEIYAKNFPGVMRLRPAMNDDNIVLTPDTLNFGRHTRFSVTNGTITLSIVSEEGLEPILDCGFEGDSSAFYGNFGAGWVGAGYDIEMNVRFRPLELGQYEARIWYETEHGIIQTVLLGVGARLNDDVNEDELLPNEFFVSDVYPNPFNSTATIDYYIPHSADILFVVYDLNGNEVYSKKQKQLSMGNHQLTLNLDGYPTGEYFLKFNAGRYQAIRKVLLMK